ncbi:GYDIA family GHMP kinase [Spongiimicrobium salis]|uniref:GYDIA family GHMP kinase n=1 Tax=Spongiimicrobium salis TaxID=1667022 RepID=UPI00374D2D3B
MTSEFYSNGKLLLTGEYLVLDGALSLALPTRYGQSMHIEAIAAPQLKWTSIDHRGEIWYEANLDVHPRVTSGTQNEISLRLEHILRGAQHLNPKFLRGAQGYAVKMQLDFPRDWGLGSSSTLINNIAQWAGVDAHELLWNTFSGSGYDISCAQHNFPIYYQLQDKIPQVTAVAFNPPFKDELHFIHLNKKQNSRDGIAHFKKRDFDLKPVLKRISEITRAMATCSEMRIFEKLILEHETLLSSILGVPSVKENRFYDYPGAIKSLGAWGGDFILATGHATQMAYFSEKGYATIIPYEQMIL